MNLRARLTWCVGGEMKGKKTGSYPRRKKTRERILQKKGKRITTAAAQPDTYLKKKTTTQRLRYQSTGSCYLWALDLSFELKYIQRALVVYFTYIFQRRLYHFERIGQNWIKTLMYCHKCSLSMKCIICRLGTTNHVMFWYLNEIFSNKSLPCLACGNINREQIWAMHHFIW